MGGTLALDTAFALESALDEAVFVVVGSLYLAIQENTQPRPSPEPRPGGRLAEL